MRVLMNAYACEPGRGSEGGVGWNWAVAAAGRHDVFVLTRANNRSAIEAGLATLGSEIRERLHFEYVDLPDAARFWKRGGLGIRVYYYVWQVLARRRAFALRRTIPFDVVHHTTLANLWLPSLVALPDTPFVLVPSRGVSVYRCSCTRRSEGGRPRSSCRSCSRASSAVSTHSSALDGDERP